MQKKNNSADLTGMIKMANYQGITMYNECRLKSYKVAGMVYLCNDVCETCRQNKQKIRVLMY